MQKEPSTRTKATQRELYKSMLKSQLLCFSGKRLSKWQNLFPGSSLCWMNKFWIIREKEGIWDVSTLQNQNIFLCIFSISWIAHSVHLHFLQWFFTGVSMTEVKVQIKAWWNQSNFCNCKMLFPHYTQHYFSVIFRMKTQNNFLYISFIPFFTHPYLLPSETGIVLSFQHEDPGFISHKNWTWYLKRGGGRKGSSYGQVYICVPYTVASNLIHDFQM